MENKINLASVLCDTRNALSDVSKDYCDCYDITSSSYICDSISEFADSQVDIYYSDRAKWFAENWEKVDDAIAELGKSDNIMQDIASAQFLEAENELYHDLDEIKQVLALQYLVDELGLQELDEELLDDILNEVDNLDNNNRLDDILDIINEKLNNQDEE